MQALFPIETQSRELDYKLIIAHHCAAIYGVKSFLGSVPSIHSNISSFKNGLYFGKNIFTRPTEAANKAFYTKVKSFGFDVAYLHEEGAVWNGSESDWVNTMNKMYDLSIFNDNDLVMLWGDWQKKEEGKRNSKDILLYVTGNPRFDLLKDFDFLYQDEVSDLRKRYGDYVLISGKYTIANHGESYHKATADVYRWHGDLNQNLKKFYDLTSFTADKMYQMVALTAKLAIDFPNINFIFRPHPSERLETYNDLFSRLDNIKVVREGAANKYILGAKALIHDGCTTAVEAATCGIPIINYKKVSSKLDTYLPSKIGEELWTVNEVKDYLIRVFDANEKFEYRVQDQLAKSLLHNLSGKSSFDAIFELLNNYFSKNSNNSEYPSNRQLNKWYYNSSNKIKLSNLKNSLIGRKDKVLRNNYLTNKFPGMTRDEIEEKIELLNTHKETKVKLTFINSQIITLDRAK